jgi:hypothetical protein
LLADLIVERYDGEIRIVEGDDGAIFEVELPTDGTLTGHREE